MRETGLKKTVGMRRKQETVAIKSGAPSETSLRGRKR